MGRVLSRVRVHNRLPTSSAGRLNNLFFSVEKRTKKKKKTTHGIHKKIKDKVRPSSLEAFARGGHSRSLPQFLPFPFIFYFSSSSFSINVFFLLRMAASFSTLQRSLSYTVERKTPIPGLMVIIVIILVARNRLLYISFPHPLITNETTFYFTSDSN